MIGIRIGRTPSHTGVHTTGFPMNQRYGRVKPLEPQGTRSRSSVHNDARIVDLAIDDIADCHYESPSITHAPRGVGVAEDITYPSETLHGISCALCAPPQGHRFRDHQSRFVLSWVGARVRMLQWELGRRTTIGLLYRL